MDLDDDGRIDILSGSYAALEGDYRKGLFQVLSGTRDGGYAAARPVAGTDGKPLMIEGTPPNDYCTRPTAADLNGDGKLDIVSGNFSGRFFLFVGEGDGRFAPHGERLTDPRGDELTVDGKSDPFFIDWDGDGDLDLLSGSGRGGVYLFTNSGTPTTPQFQARLELVPRPDELPLDEHGEPLPGIDHVKGPQDYTRVWAGDVDDDGRLDLLVGDTLRVRHVLPEFTAEEVARHDRMRAELDELNERISQINDELRKIDSSDAVGRQTQRDRIDDAVERYRALQSELPQEYVGTGFVWLYRGK